MKTVKTMFMSWHYASPEILLETLKRMTPGCSGKWDNGNICIEATLSENEADYHVIFDGYRGKFDPKKAIYAGQHPQGGSPSFKDYKGIECVKALSLDKYLNIGEVWLPYSYDYLMALEPPKKTKNLCCIMTYQKDYDQSQIRVKFMHEFVKKYKKYSQYGRPIKNFENDELFKDVYKGCLGNNTYDAYKGEHLIGKEKVGEYRYSLEYDQGPCRNYMSERFYDAMLMWTMPIYWGSSNVHEFLPENSFRYVDIQNPNESEIDKVINIVESDFREQNIEAMKEARYLLLNKYQTWPYICNVINNL